MTLAVVILLFGFSSSPVTGWNTASAQSAQPADSTQGGSTPATQENTAGKSTGAQGTVSGPTQKPPAHKTAKKPIKKTAQKKVVTPNCDSATESSPKNVPGAANSSDPPNTQTGQNQPPKNCPPEKIVVRHGGTTEPSIQLAGGDRESQKRNETNQMLGSTDENLKKISSIQLNQDQQDTVSQIKQFVDESKKALASGDLERGHTLAWKAQLLSEDLVKPQK